jgi:phospho-N-acetylmuramoyl-pentapeptide-transferase
MVKGSNGSKAGAIAAGLAALDSSGEDALMLYWLYQHLAAGGYVPFLNLLKYLTFRTGMAIFTAQLIVAVAMGSRFIRWMQAKQGKGQPIRKEGIERHVVEKAGTPTMGGFMILAGLLVGTLLWADLSNPYVWAVIMVTAGYGVLGFLDDYAKVTKQTTGASPARRLVLEFAVAIVAAVLMIIFAPKSPMRRRAAETRWSSRCSSRRGEPGLVLPAVRRHHIVGAANAVNFTDGLDGLATCR